MGLKIDWEFYQEAETFKEKLIQLVNSEEFWKDNGGPLSIVTQEEARRRRKRYS